MSTTVTRFDPLGNVGSDNTKPVVLSQETFATIGDAAASIRARGVPLTAEHEARIAAESEATVFSWREFVEVANSVVLAQVRYHVVVNA